MKNNRKAITILLISVLLLSGVAAVSSALPEGPTPMGETRRTIDEVGDETHYFSDAKPIQSGDVYYGQVNRVDDRADYLKFNASAQQVINVHLYITGHDGTTEWIEPDDAPPTPGRPTGIFATFLYTGLSPNERLQPIDGAFNYFFTRHYVLNICSPVPDTNTYYVNISMDWFMTPNNFSWEYYVDLDIGQAQVINSGQRVSDQIDLETRDTHWYKISAKFEDEINGSFEILNFNEGDPTERDLNVWVFPEDLGGYPFSYPWDWSAAPNEPIEPFNVLSTYDGWFFIKLRGMNHTNSLPISYTFKAFTKPIEMFPDTGIQNMYFDRFNDDTDWYKFEMKANQPHATKPGYWNEVVYFNMTERADAEELPDFDLYLFGRVPGALWLDLLDSSFRNDHPDFFDPNRDPNKNTEHVYGAAFYNGTYYVEVNAWNNTGYYDVRREWKPSVLSDMDNLPENAKLARAGVYESHIHQSEDHYDWYKVEARERIRIQFDSFKGTDLFNASIFKYDSVQDEYILIVGDWNTWFNFTSREDHIGNLIDMNVELSDFGLGAGTYYVGVFAAVAAQMAYDQTTQRSFIYKTDSDAEANYELRVWVDDTPPFSRPPQIIKGIPNLVVDEDTDKVDYIDLSDHFIDTDVGDDDLRFKASVMTGKVRQLILDQNAETLGFEAFPDFYGKVVVKVTAIDKKYLQSSLIWNITFTSVNDAPRATYDTADPYEYAMPEDAYRLMDLKLLVTDVDRDDQINITWVPNDNLIVSIQEESLIATVVGAEDFFGEVTLNFIAKDLSDATTNLPVRFVLENVEDDPRLIKPVGERVIFEDGFDTLPMFDHFEDPDGDDLMFTLSSNLNVVFDVDLDTGIMTLTPEPDWFGFREIWVTATDTTGRVAQTKFIFIVDPINDDPILNSWSPPGAEVTLNEDASQSFVVLNVSDPEFSILIYQWYLDGKLVGPSNFYNYRPTFDAQGDHELRVVVIDEENAQADHTWIIHVNDVPRPPEGGIASPANHGVFTSSEKVSFVALYYDLDGDVITYQWYIDGKPQSTDSTFEKGLGTGKHEVQLVVQSGDFTLEDNFVTITVEQAETPGFEAPLVFAGLAVTFVAAAAWRRLRMK